MQRVTFGLICVCLTGCPADDRDDDGSLTGADEEAVAACAAAESEQACLHVDVAQDYRCAWVRTLTVESEESCATREELRCLAYRAGGATPGCAPIQGCEASGPDRPGTLVVPAYRENAVGEIELVDECGSPGAVGFTACESGASGTDVTACACVCESAPG